MADQTSASARSQPQQSSSAAQQAPPQHPNASYPSPHSHSYPSPSMQPTYSYPPSQALPNSEAYRASPTGANVPAGGLNLPPIRAMDGQGQTQAYQQVSQPAMGSPLPPPVAPAYYPQPPGQHLPPPGQSMALPYGRMPLQGGDQRMMSGGRHKKEIKRRTKTGCLTCRKRRIKCDETHPTCRNCQKSKRDCLGYDPIFKQQPGPAALQPAPPAASATPPAVPSIPTPSGSAPYSHIPQGYAPAVSAGYPSPGAATSTEQTPPYSAIDPALGAAESTVVPMSSSSYDPALVARQDVKSSVDSGTPYAIGFQVKQNQIEDLFSYGGVVPPQTPSNTVVNLEEIKKLYVNDYAPGLDKLLETTWYSTKGLEHLLADDALCQTFEFLRQKFLLASGPSQYEAARQIPSLEAKVTWQLLCLCRKETPSSAVNGTNGTIMNDPATEELQLDEIKARLNALEHLLTGQPLEANPLLLLQYSNVTEADPKHFQIDFWKNLGSYVLDFVGQEASNSSTESALGGMRSTLHQLENRDVIYSIAIVRQIGGKPEIASSLHNQQHQAWSNDPEDDHNKLFVAKRFLEDESQNGMTQVIARFAGMAVTGWGPTSR